MIKESNRSRRINSIVNHLIYKDRSYSLDDLGMDIILRLNNIEEIYYIRKILNLVFNPLDNLEAIVTRKIMDLEKSLNLEKERTLYMDFKHYMLQSLFTIPSIPHIKVELEAQFVSKLWILTPESCKKLEGLSSKPEFVPCRECEGRKSSKACDYCQGVGGEYHLLHPIIVVKNQI